MASQYFMKTWSKRTLLGVPSPHCSFAESTTRGIAPRRRWSTLSYRCVYTDDISETLSAKYSGVKKRGQIFLNAAGVSLGKSAEQPLYSGLDGSKDSCASSRAHPSIADAYPSLPPTSSYPGNLVKMSPSPAGLVSTRTMPATSSGQRSAKSLASTPPSE